MAKKGSPISTPPPVLPSLAREKTVELLRGQKYKGEELLRKSFLSLEDVQQWSFNTKDILAKAFGSDCALIDVVLYAAEPRVYSMYEPESILEKHRRKDFQASLKALEICIEQLRINEGFSKPDVSKIIPIIKAEVRKSPAPQEPNGIKQPAIQKEILKSVLGKSAERKEITESQEISVVHIDEQGEEELEFHEEIPLPDKIRRAEIQEIGKSPKVTIIQLHDEGEKEPQFIKEAFKPDIGKKREGPAIPEKQEVFPIQGRAESKKEPGSAKGIPKPEIDQGKEIPRVPEGPKVFAPLGHEGVKKEPQLRKEIPKPAVGERTKIMETLPVRKVLIVHGHDEEKKEAAAALVKRLGLEPVILHEQPNQGINLIEKFEQHSDVGFAIIILTGDDYGYPKGRPEEIKPRPRQNVVFELGFLIGHFKGQRICALHEEKLELPPYYQGVVFIPHDTGGLWQLLMARTMKMANMDIDLNKAI